MALPYFFVEDLQAYMVKLDEDTSKHMISVLRIQKGASVLLTNGKGLKATAVVEDDNRKKCMVSIRERQEQPLITQNIAIGISLLKNTTRFEWFLEKATEIGVREIIPLVCERTEKEKFRPDRMQQILVSALLQSQQCWLPVLHEPTSFEKITSEYPAQRKYIAHCLPEQKNSLSQQLTMEAGNISSRLILIGPEGDFSPREIRLALDHGFLPVSLGDTRLRTETAGMVAAVMMMSNEW
jgi:16S rRNA (uracil1498-N3)-methyltransferase